MNRTRRMAVEATRFLADEEQEALRARSVIRTELPRAGTPDAPKRGQPKNEGFYYEWPWDDVVVYNVTWRSRTGCSSLG